MGYQNFPQCYKHCPQVINNSAQNCMDMTAKNHIDYNTVFLSDMREQSGKDKNTGESKISQVHGQCVKSVGNRCEFDTKMKTISFVTNAQKRAGKETLYYDIIYIS